MIFFLFQSVPKKFNLLAIRANGHLRNTDPNQSLLAQMCDIQCTS